MLKFSLPETSRQYECLVEQDRMVHKAEGKLRYSGLLSNIPASIARAMVAGGSNLLKEKAETHKHKTPLRIRSRKSKVETLTPEIESHKDEQTTITSD